VVCLVAATRILLLLLFTAKIDGILHANANTKQVVDLLQSSFSKKEEEEEESNQRLRFVCVGCTLPSWVLLFIVVVVST